MSLFLYPVAMVKQPDKSDSEINILFELIVQGSSLSQWGSQSSLK